MPSQIDVAIRDLQPQMVAYVSMRGPYTKMQQAFGTLFGWLGRKGLVPAGPPSGAYYNAPGEVPEDQLLWELRCPVAGDSPPIGPDENGLGVKLVEAAQVAATMHKGPFQKVGMTWDALGKWIVANGYQIVGPGIEIYLSDPGQTKPEDLLTEVAFPVCKT
ncbi:MAG: hypothetical protein A2Y61_03890 [Chloroflexi bacterium RBG_13_60_13]|nr:MAG: hypothetical protein A2Y61_03890 [Chloroflexi bacterium RBG_13_60_13]